MTLSQPTEDGPLLIKDGDVIYRRLAPSQREADGKPNSSAFKRNGIYDNKISVDLARLTTPQESVNRAPKAGFTLCQANAGQPRTLGFEVVHDPKPDNRAHSEIRGQNSRAYARELARMFDPIEGIVSSDPG